LFAFLLVLSLRLAGGIGPRSVVADANADERAPSGVPKAGEAKDELSLAFEQVSSPSDVILKLTLTNESSDHSLWINARPRFGIRVFRGRDTEVELSMMDRHHRAVLDLCEHFRQSAKRSSFVVLKPKQRIEVLHTLDPRCYSLEPGEVLLTYVTFKHLESPPDPESGSTVFDGEAGAKNWQNVVVPKGWKDTATPKP